MLLNLLTQKCSIETGGPLKLGALGRCLKCLGGKAALKNAVNIMPLFKVSKKRNLFQNTLLTKSDKINILQII